MRTRALPYLSQIDIDRFWLKVDRRDDDACWLWQACLSNKGYGQFGVGSTLFLAHRIAWLISTGNDPGELHVLHSCDSPACVNKRHLFLGTQVDNMADMTRKGRADHSKNPRGEKVATSKLTADEIQEIWRLHLNEGLGQRKLAARFNVTPPNIHCILSGQTWKEHIPADTTPHVLPRNGFRRKQITR